MEPVLRIGIQIGEDPHGVRRERVRERGLAPLGREPLLDLARERLLALDGLARYLASGLLGYDRRLDVLRAHAGKLGVLGAHAFDLHAQRTARRRALGHGEAAHEVVGGVQQHDRLLVGDAPDDAAGDLGVFLVFFREECVGRLSAVPAHHLPAAVVELAHERQVGEPLLLDALRELRDAGLVHRVGGVGGVVGYLFDGDPLDGVVVADRCAPVKQPGDGEPRCRGFSHGAPPRRAPRSPWRAGCSA